MSSVVSGLIGGLIAVALTAYIANRVGKSGTDGRLSFGPFMWGLGIACFVLALLPVISTIYFGHNREFWAKAALFAGFGLGAIYCFGEAALVRGKFDENGIEFHTPWTGTKREKWQDLQSVELNDWCSWYTLTFKSGSKVRLSRYLSGHLSVLEAIGSRGEF